MGEGGVGGGKEMVDGCLEMGGVSSWSFVGVEVAGLGLGDYNSFAGRPADSSRQGARLATAKQGKGIPSLPRKRVS